MNPQSNYNLNLNNPLKNQSKLFKPHLLLTKLKQNSTTSPIPKKFNNNLKLLSQITQFSKLKFHKIFSLPLLKLIQLNLKQKNQFHYIQHKELKQMYQLRLRQLLLNLSKIIWPKLINFSRLMLQ